MESYAYWKPGEPFSILEKTSHNKKKFDLHRSYFFDLLNSIINEKSRFYFPFVDYLSIEHFIV